MSADNVLKANLEEAAGVLRKRLGDRKPAVGIVLGSEGGGTSRLVLEKCDFRVTIPNYGHVNSLNVSCAAAVVLAKASGQRHQ